MTEKWAQNGLVGKNRIMEQFQKCNITVQIKRLS